MERVTPHNRLLAIEDGESVSMREPVVVESPAVPAPRPMRARLLAAVPVVLVVASILAGTGLRVFAYARNQSLWIDEAMLALNVVYRTSPELLEPLDLNQGAPVGYLLMCKTVTTAFGGSELMLRLPSFVAGLIGLALFVPLAYRALPLAAARAAVILFSLAPYLIGYSAEFKQYGLDATIAVGLMLLGLPVWRSEAGRWRMVALAAGGALAVWFSHPAAFVLGGVGLAALADAAVRRDWPALAARCAVVAAWGVSFATCYFLFTRKLGMNQYLLDYWAGKFMPLPPTRPGDIMWIFHHFFAFFIAPAGFEPDIIHAAGLAGVCFLIGCLAMARADWRLLVATVTPLVLALLASGLHKYPFAGRLLIFAVPAALVVVGYGAVLIAERLEGVARWSGLVFLVALFIAPAHECYMGIKRPIHAEDAREVIAYAHENWQAGDQAYVFYAASAAFEYYQPQYPFPREAVRVGVENRDKDISRFQEELRPFRGQKRVWVLIAHRQSTEEYAIQAYLDGMGKCEEKIRFRDAVVMRYDLR
ncbi:hypothetical protein [Fimbriiglobus ruber]|uniref:Glycosyltransferase RgtA/B/C/D-like domain-containing protein n=1 Tax=Fimbriiglobus ruber TaxID=1908690 RepID=A0A225DF97_9BACT|nr:hypothetical protein [Fimbriiglobus ruber]OWK36016.1 hypothetical protein FRUB_08579 [Fimbriiglobus ruber]